MGEVIQFIPKPRDRDLAVITPFDVVALYSEASIEWMKAMNQLVGLADTAPCDIVPFDKDSA